jgi:hypothetical protein
MKKITVLLIGALFMLSSCATIFTGTKDTISFNSNPQGAKVLIDGIEICKTPCSSSVKRSLSDEQVEFKLEGYQTRLITLDQEFNVVSVLNLFGLVGWAVDAATGSLMKYDKKAYTIDLEKDNKVSQLNPSKIEINTSDNVIDIYVVQK